MQAQLTNPFQPTWVGLIFTCAMNLVELEIYQHDKFEFGWKNLSTLSIQTPIYWDISSLVLRPKSPLILATRPKLFWKGGSCYTNWTFDSDRPLWTFSLVTVSHPIQCSFLFFYSLVCLPKGSSFWVYQYFLQAVLGRTQCMDIAVVTKFMRTILPAIRAF